MRAPLFAILAIALGTSLSAAEDASPSGEQPAQIVDTLDDTLTGVMKDAKALGFSGRSERLSPVIHRVFDLDFMAEKIAGRHWKSMSPEERTQLVDTFSRYTIANYAGRFSGWSGQEFKRLGQEPSARGTMMVRTELLDPDGDDVQLDYRLRHTDETGWKIIDVYFNGTVSELALRRSEYSSLIKREGLPALITALDERIAELAAPPPDSD